ncbi:hypothetical protein QN277_024044 [Acacia crassicarpa]|uniref:Uncharacterized protein n=1 Tax=Acacia crassicarpa TaxID=499986 RepID=A0AAE1JEV1_9FABA|nr:hypothetical protein QN277_024044 [Acacia crassicarpa]
MKLACIPSKSDAGKKDSTARYDPHLVAALGISWAHAVTIRLVCFIASFSMAIHVGVCCNGAIHWSSQGEDSVYFEVDSQCLKTSPMPPDSEDWEYRNLAYFGEVHGSSAYDTDCSSWNHHACNI